MCDIADAIAENKAGVIITLDVSAGGRTDCFPAGYNQWRKALGCQVRAPPVGGKANKSIISCVASALGVPRSSVSIVSGSTASSKRVLVEGTEKQMVLEILQHMVSRIDADK
jgi:uncharacterized protein (TIGR00251 family)